MKVSLVIQGQLTKLKVSQPNCQPTLYLPKVQANQYTLIEHALQFTSSLIFCSFTRVQ